MFKYISAFKFPTRTSWRIGLCVVIGILCVEAVILVPSLERYDGELREEARAQLDLLFTARAADARTEADLVALARDLPYVTQVAVRPRLSDAGLPAKSGTAPDLLAETFAADSAVDYFGTDSFHVWFSFDEEQIATAHLGYVARISGLVLLICLSVLAVTLWSVHYFALRPMRRLQDALTEAAEHAHDPKSCLMKDIPKTEIGAAMTALNSLLTSIDVAQARERAQRKELSESELRFRAMFAQSNDGIILIDPETGQLLDANIAAQNLLEYKLEEVRQLTAFQVHSHELERIEAFLSELKSCGASRTGEMSCQTKSGKLIFADIVGNMITIGDKQAVLVHVRDNSARIELEEGLRRAFEAAERANRAKTAFLATMSHELRTPMNAIIGLTNLLADNENLTQEQKKYVDTIKSSGTGLLQIINDVLDFAMLQARKVTADATAFEPKILLEGFIGNVRPLAEQKGLEMRVNLHDNLGVSVTSDPKRIVQIIRSLTCNAIKFTEAGHVKLSARLAHAMGGKALMIEVEDTGIGIAPEHQEKLFDRFSQAEDFETRRFGGAGLGLSICKQLVDLLGGQIGVVSTEGKGSSFWVRLPVEIGEDQADTPGESSRKDPPRLARTG